MAKYRIGYRFEAKGYFFVKAPSLNLAYEKMHKRFHMDNSLFVHAKYPDRFEILNGTEHDGPFPAASKIPVTSMKDIRKAKDGQSRDDVPHNYPKFGNTGLFDFSDEQDTE